MQSSPKSYQQLVFYFDSQRRRTNRLLSQLLQKVSADLTSQANLFTLLIYVHGMQFWERAIIQQFFGFAHNILQAWTDHDTIPFADSLLPIPVSRVLSANSYSLISACKAYDFDRFPSSMKGNL
jgi:hypothetical protein